MNKQKSIGVLGCGWLGFPYANALVELEYKVKGTTTSIDKLAKLNEANIQPFLINLQDENTYKSLQLFLNGLDILVITIPPQYNSDQISLLNSFENIFQYYDFQHIQKLIYISSTGVFEDGLNKVYNESSIPNNNSKRGKRLIDLESFISKLKEIPKICILRYGGLIEYGGRHPIYYLNGRNNVQNPKGAINIIEKQDAINLLLKITKQDNNLPINHGVYPDHPQRQTYYTHKARELGLKPPNFNLEKESIGKRISSDKTAKHLNFSYKRPIW